MSDQCPHGHYVVTTAFPSLDKPNVFGYSCQTCGVKFVPITRTAEIEAERDGLRRQVIAGVYDAASVGMTLIQTEKLDMLKADAERYRWLRDCGLHHQIIGRITQSVGCGPYIAMRLPSTTSFNTVELDAGAADAAIDAAIKESKTWAAR